MKKVVVLIFPLLLLLLVNTKSLIVHIPKNVPLKQVEFWGEMKAEQDSDPLYAEAVDLIRRHGRASISMLQRRLRIGYTRAARLIDTMESNGIIGGATGGSLPREVLDYGSAAPPKDD